MKNVMAHISMSNLIKRNNTNRPLIHIHNLSTFVSRTYSFIIRDLYLTILKLSLTSCPAGSRKLSSAVISTHKLSLPVFFIWMPFTSLTGTLFVDAKMALKTAVTYIITDILFTRCYNKNWNRMYADVLASLIFRYQLLDSLHIGLTFMRFRKHVYIWIVNFTLLLSC